MDLGSRGLGIGAEGLRVLDLGFWGFEAYFQSLKPLTLDAL